MSKLGMRRGRTEGQSPKQLQVLVGRGPEPACPPVSGSPAPVPSSSPPEGPWGHNSGQGVCDQAGSSTHLSMERRTEWRAESQVYSHNHNTHTLTHMLTWARSLFQAGLLLSHSVSLSLTHMHMWAKNLTQAGPLSSPSYLALLLTHHRQRPDPRIQTQTHNDPTPFPFGISPLAYTHILPPHDPRGTCPLSPGPRVTLRSHTSWTASSLLSPYFYTPRVRH